MIPIPNGLIGGIIVLLFGSFVGSNLVINASKSREELYRTSGPIAYLHVVYGDLPHRDQGKHRFLRVDGFPCVFDIYVPNSEPTVHSIDELIVGDQVEVFHYKSCDIEATDTNRSVRFIDHAGEAWFITNHFYRDLGYSLVGLSILAFLLILYFWRKGKIGLV